MRVRKNWLDYDIAAVTLLMIGLAAVELLGIAPTTVELGKEALPTLSR